MSKPRPLSAFWGQWGQHQELSVPSGSVQRAGSVPARAWPSQQVLRAELILLPGLSSGINMLDIIYDIDLP